MYVDSNGVYHAKFDCWQANAGYNNAYDFFFDVGTSMNRDKFEFTSGGQDYAIWVWKGDYINFGFGAELGIYKKLTIYGFDTPQWLVDKNLSMKMTLTLKDSDGNVIIDYAPDEKQWWITGFNPNYMDIPANQLTAIYGLTFNDKKMYQSFKKKMKLGKKGWTFNDDNYSAQYEF